eukprot:TRINITY_DN1684_c0_g1_i10.p1 TRINITY_DN1684_c0_g1~~TRINITY_DN1684_c0_g1_i10.p1  ORF type:complete len:201 (-),score=27.88 TRINITY_DN1684_c0_g1_i10:216-818(-)
MPAETKCFSEQLPGELLQCLKDSEEEMANGGILYETTEFYVMIHSTPILSQCQHFLCNNTNEVNMMYHSWAFPDVPFAFETDIGTTLWMGLFGTKSIRPVHLDLMEGGIAFDCLKPRLCIIHHCAFSPENAQFQLLDDEISWFFSLAILKGPECWRRVLFFLLSNIFIIPPTSMKSFENTIQIPETNFHHSVSYFDQVLF